MPRVCIFCSGSPVTQEHLISEWIRTSLPQLTDPNVSTIDIAGRPSKTWQNDSPASLSVGRVCDPCNTQWMSQIESAAKTALLPMMQGTNTVLTGNDQRAVAEWAVLKAMVWEFEDDDTASFSAAERTDFHQSRIVPAHCRVLLGEYAGPRNCVFQHLRLTAQDDPFNARRPHSTTLSIGRLVLHVVGLGGLQDWNFRKQATKFRNVLQLIFPATGRLVLWPPRYGIDDTLIERVWGAWFTDE